MDFNGNSALEAVTSDVKVNGSVENDALLVDAVSNGRGGYTSDDDEVFEAALDKLPIGARTSTTEDDDEDEDEDDDVGEVFGSGRRGEGEVVEEEKENGEGLALENGFEKISEEDAVEVGGVADGDGLVVKTEREVGDGVGDVEVFETALDKLPVGTNMTEEDDDEGEVFGLGKGVDVGGGEGVVLEDGVKFTSSGDAIVEDVCVDVVAPGVVVVGEVEEGVFEVENGEGLPLENGFEELSKDAVGAVEVGGEPKEMSRVEDGEDEGVRGSVDVVADGDGDGLVVKSEREVEVVGDGVINSGDAEAASVKEKVEIGVWDEVREADDTLVKDSIAVSDAAIGRDVDVGGDEKCPSSEGEVYANGGENDGSARVKVDANGGGKGVNAEAEVNVDGGENDVSAVAENNVDTAVTQIENDDDDNSNLEDGEIEGLDTDEEMEEIVFESPEAAQQFLEELERGSGFGAESSHDNSQRIDGQIVTDSDEEVDTDEEGDEKELYDSAALAALLKAATGVGSDDGTITLTSQDGSRLFSVERPAGLGSTLRSLRPAAARQHRPNLFTSSAMASGGASENNLSDEEREKLEKLQQIRVKFLRLIHRLGHSPEEATASQVLYRLALAAGRQANQQSSLEAASKMALQQEDGKDDLDFSLNILVLGKTGVGKSATINSIFGEQKSPINAFEPVTDSVKEITGVVDGMKIRVLDIPGLRSPAVEQGKNRKVLFAVKRMVKKFPPDIILYVDRLDIQTRDLNDMPLLRTITDVLGSSIWRSAIVTLTHASSAPPDGPSGSPVSYEVFVAQRSHVVQQSVGQACGDLRLMNPTLMNPVALVENHPSCRKNREGQKVLPNGQAWRSQLLLLCCSVKILSEASSLSKPQDPLDHKKLFGFRARSPPLPYLLSWLLQSRTHPRLPTDQGGDSIDSDVDLADLSDSDDLEEKDEYDGLPTFKPLRKNQLAKLTGEQKKAYLEEYDYRVKLLQKKQWKQELRRIREMKKRGKVAGGDIGGDVEEDDADGGAPASVAVPLPDMVLPPSFDSDNPGYRYRFLEPTSQFLARPVLDSHGWDHDCGYDGVNVEQSLAVINQFPAAIAVQVTKDKKEFTLHLDSSISAKHGDTGSSMAGFDIQNVGKQLAYVVRGETKFKNFKKNKTGAGVSVTFLGKNVATGVKVEDQISLGKRLTLVGSTGTVRSQGDAAYGANVEVRLTDADYPVEQDQSSLGLSLVKWRGDLALGANLQSQFSIGRGSKVAVRAGLNNKMSGQLTVKTSSSEQLQLALVGLLPIVLSIYKTLRPGAPDKYSMY